MKIFFILDSLANAGTEKSYLQLLPEFSHEIQLQVVYFYPDHSLIDKFREKEIQTIYLDNQKKYSFLKGIKKLLALVRKEKPDLMVSSLMRSNLISRAVSKISGIPLVGTLVSDSYGDTRLETFQGKQLFKFKLFWQLDKWTSTIPSHWIANSGFIAKSHTTALGIPREKIEVVYRGREIPDKLWNRGEKPLNQEVKEKNIEFVGVGRLLVTKGWIELLESFAHVNEKYPKCTLTIYGEGPLRRELEEKIGKFGLKERVFLPGNVPQVQEKLFDYDCFVFPSWYEGFSGALVEAMMAGIPIIASDIPMNLEAVTPNINALTFPVKDYKALAEQMTYAIKHPSEMALLGKNARMEATKRFDIQVIAKQYEQVLFEVLASEKAKARRSKK